MTLKGIDHGTSRTLSGSFHAELETTIPIRHNWCILSKLFRVPSLEKNITTIPTLWTTIVSRDIWRISSKLFCVPSVTSRKKISQLFQHNGPL